MRNVISVTFILALSACAGNSIGPRSAPIVPTSALGVMRHATPTNWTVTVSSSTDHYALQTLDFYPNSIVIDAGDTITYAFAGDGGEDAHTVTFVPPNMKIPTPVAAKDLSPAGGTIIDGKKFVNSGIEYGAQNVTFTFPKPGTYRILCLFHNPAMQSAVIVQNAGAPYPHNAAYYRGISAMERSADVAEARSSVALFPFKQGGTTLAAGIDPGLVTFPPPDATVLRYVDTKSAAKVAGSGNLTIKAGTIVTWINETSNEPHTLTLNVAGKKGLPKINPDPPVNVVPPPGITTYDGSKVVNSGTFWGGSSFQLKFTKPGSYYYGCIYHANSGMSGTIVVTM